MNLERTTMINTDSVIERPKYYYIIKNGYYYRPEARGYTGERSEAGHFSEFYAKRELAEVEGVRIVEGKDD